MRCNSILKIIFLTGGVAISLGSILFILPWGLLCVGGLVNSLKTPTPEIRHGEFPFILEYEVNGERFIIEDILIAEYSGINRFTTGGNRRQWRRSFASGNEEIVLKEINEISRVVFNPGSAEYYMGDGGMHYTPRFPDAILTTGNGGFRIINADELLDQYDIKLINFEYADPIINNFR